MSFVNHNGILFPSDSPLITAANPCFKWGEGVFETLRVSEGTIHLAQYHWERLLTGLNLLHITYADDFIENLEAQVRELCKQNNCIAHARVRLTAFRGSDGKVATVVEAIPLDALFLKWSNDGWRLGLFTHAVIAPDRYANIKKVSYLPYRMAAQYSSLHGFQECLLLNTQGHPCDGGKTNFFIIKDGRIYTPSLTEGCIAGTMRRHIITTLSGIGTSVIDSPITLEMLLNADEVFLTNAIVGIKWVASFREKVYACHHTRQLYDLLQIA